MDLYQQRRGRLFCWLNDLASFLARDLDLLCRDCPDCYQDTNHSSDCDLPEHERRL